MAVTHINHLSSRQQTRITPKTGPFLHANCYLHQQKNPSSELVLLKFHNPTIVYLCKGDWVTNSCTHNLSFMISRTKMAIFTFVHLDVVAYDDVYLGEP